MGIPAIGTRWFGIPSIIVHGETGLLVDPKSVEQLAHALTAMIGDRAKTRLMGLKARHRVTTRYTATVIAREYINHYSGSDAFVVEPASECGDETKPDDDDKLRTSA